MWCVRNRPVFACLSVLLLLGVPALAHGATDGPPFPGQSEHHDALAVRPLVWYEDARNETAIVVESEREEIALAFELERDAAFIEGALVDLRLGNAGAVFVTGVRHHRITFEPPMVLADGSLLRAIIPAALDWRLDLNATSAPDTSMEPGDESRYIFQAQVPPAGPDGFSPPAGNDTDPNATTGITLDWHVFFFERPGADPTLYSPAAAMFHYGLDIPPEARASDQPVTNVTFSLVHDFGGGPLGAALTGASGATQGVVLYRGAFGAVLDLGPGAPVSLDPARGDPPNETARPLLSPITLNRTFLLEADDQEFALNGRLGYLADASVFEDPSPSPSNSDDGGDDEEAESPLHGVPLLVLLVVCVLVLRRRTEASR